MKILITGNMGYIGPVVIQQLRAAYPGAVLIGYDLGLFGRNLTNTEILPECRVDLQYFNDIRSFPASILPEIDVIVHLAAISNDSIGNNYQDVTMDVNYRASTDLAVLAKKAGVKTFVFASSCSVYGAAAYKLTSEESPVNPLTAYAESKVLTEKALETLADQNFKVTCLRFATGCGMSERLRLGLILNNFAAEALALKKISVSGDGTPWRALINIKDMALAVDWAIRRDISDGGEYLVVNIGHDRWNYQIKELAEAVAEILPDCEVFIKKDDPTDKRSYKVKFALFQSLAPNFQPQCDLHSSVRELVEGLKAMGFNDQNFGDSNLVRLKVLENLRGKNLITERLTWAVK